MKLNEIIEFYRSRYPEELQEKWDRSGIQIGNFSREVSKVLFVLDITKDSLAFAKEKKIDLIISHHPLFFSPIQSLVESDGKSQLVLSLIRENIEVYSMHTNIDKVEDGVSNLLLNELNLGNDGILDEEGFVRYTRCNESFSFIAEKIKTVFHKNRLMYYGNPEKSIGKIAVCGGSGGSFVDLCIENDVDLYITGDVKHHDVESALLNDMNIVDLGHFDSEVHILRFLKRELKEKYPNLEIYLFDENPYRRKFI